MLLVIIVTLTYSILRLHSIYSEHSFTLLLFHLTHLKCPRLDLFCKSACRKRKALQVLSCLFMQLSSLGAYCRALVQCSFSLTLRISRQHLMSFINGGRAGTQEDCVHTCALAICARSGHLAFTVHLLSTRTSFHFSSREVDGVCVWRYQRQGGGLCCLLQVSQQHRHSCNTRASFCLSFPHRFIDLQ